MPVTSGISFASAPVFGENSCGKMSKIVSTFRTESLRFPLSTLEERRNRWIQGERGACHALTGHLKAAHIGFWTVLSTIRPVPSPIKRAVSRRVIESPREGCHVPRHAHPIPLLKSGGSPRDRRLRNTWHRFSGIGTRLGERSQEMRTRGLAEFECTVLSLRTEVWMMTSWDHAKSSVLLIVHGGAVASGQRTVWKMPLYSVVRGLSGPY